MARLEAQAKGLYYPTQLEEVDEILKWIRPGRDGARVIDICCGKGMALQRVAQTLKLTAYGIELQEDRAKQSAKLIDESRILNTSWEKTECEVTPESFQVSFLNPPYDSVQEGDKTVRLEYLATVRATRLLQPGGIMILVLPWYALCPKDPRGSKQLVPYLAAHYKKFTLGRFADANYFYWVDEDGKKHDYGFAQIALICVRGNPENEKRNLAELLALADPTTYGGTEAIAAKLDANLRGEQLSAVEEGKWLPTLAELAKQKTLPYYQVPEPKTDLIRFWAVQRNIAEEAQVVMEQGIWATSREIFERCLLPNGAGQEYGLLMEPSLNNKATLISTGALDTLLIFDSRRPEELRPKVAPEEYLRWPVHQKRVSANHQELLSVTSTNYFQGFSDCAVTFKGQIIFLSLFGMAPQLRAVLASLKSGKAVYFDSAPDFPYRPRTVGSLQRTEQKYLHIRQPLVSGWEHHVLVHPLACFNALPGDGQKGFFIVGANAKENFGLFLSKRENVPFLPAWSEEIYKWGRAAGYIQELSSGPEQLVTTTALTVNFPEGAVGQFLSDALAKKKLPVPKHYDFLGRGVTTKQFATIDHSYEAETDREIIVQVEHIETRTFVLYFDGRLKELLTHEKSEEEAPIKGLEKATVVVDESEEDEAA
jgi:hypothetical protein